MQDKNTGYEREFINRNIQEIDNVLSKKEFMQQYILNRCIGNTGAMEGNSVAKEALDAFDFIKGECG